jgi:ACR3 family arsenite efflux pump ArsB
MQRNHYKKEKQIVQDTQEEKSETAIEELPAPQGIGMAVAFDWGLAAQIFFTPILSIVFNQPSPIAIPGANPALGKVLLFVIAWPVACIPAFFGEMVRRGRNWTRKVQIVVNALLTLAGIASLVMLYQSIRAGNYWPVVTEVILVIFSPLIVWRMSRSSTARWFKTVTVAEASKRHGGKWVLFIIIWGAVGGLLQAFAAMKR